MRKFEKNIEDRKQLVARLKELTGLESRYTFVPRCAYLVGSFTVEKDGSLTVEEGADEQVLDTLIADRRRHDRKRDRAGSDRLRGDGKGRH